MSGVVLRCANCGSAQASAGECQTCHGAAVRFFCSNHDPGHWLDGSTCPECGARFGTVSASAAPAAPAPARAADDGAAQAIARCLEAHELLLRALLTHLAMTSPDSFGAIVNGVLRSRNIRADVAQEVTTLVEEIAASLRG
jgi:hypothetical protein